MKNFTIAICTFNGEQRLPLVLERLYQQEFPEAIEWEVIVVDNNSTDNTAQVVADFQDHWLPGVSLRLLQEAEQGLVFARRCAIHHADSPLIGFLDDDNWPDKDWVFQAYQFGRAHPQAGAYGGQIKGVFESEPPPGFQEISAYFALVDSRKTYCYNEKYKQTRLKLFPPGAGIVIRKEAWLKSIPDRQAIVGVKGNSLATKSEDVEMLSYLFYKGWEIWFNDRMFMEHYIPKKRLEKTYLIEFFTGIGLSRYTTRMIAYQKWQYIFVIPAYLISDLIKIIVFYVRYYRELRRGDPVLSGKFALLKAIPQGLYTFLKGFPRKT
jgi:glycosyltransferase involved in cell wall biosynthesis